MIVTSGIYREFYPQAGNFSVQTSFTVPDTTTNCFLGLSGSSGYCGVSLKNGKILDNSQRFVSTYPIGQPVSIDLNVSLTAYDLYVNDYPVIFSDSKFSGKSTSLIFITSEEIDDFSYTLAGYVPNYIYSDNIIFNATGSYFTGYFRNLDSDPIKIYSGSFNGDINTFNVSWPPSTINSNSSGMFIVSINSTGLGAGYTLSNTIYTNFGNIDLDINVSGVLPAPTPYNISLFGPNIIPINTSANYFGQFFSNSGELLVVPILQHISGSGSTYLQIPISAPYSANLSGYISRSGNLSTFITGLGSGQGGGFNLGITGNISGYAYQFAWATGYLSVVKQIRGQGYVNTSGYSGPVSGLISAPISGTIYNGSGSLFINQDFTQNLNTVYTTQPTSFIPSTGYIYYNTPLSAVTSDILYVNTNRFGIVYGFHYNSIDSLVNYLNTNTGRHGVTGYKIDSNTIRLGSLISTTSGNLLLQVDTDNDGTMAVSSGISGGRLLGLGSGISVSTLLTGHYSGYVHNSGVYSLPSTGRIYGSGLVLDTQRRFQDTWNLYTGMNYFNMTSYKDSNYYGVSGFLSPYSISSNNTNNIYIQVAYNAQDSRVPDVARLVLSGINSAAGYYEEIYIGGGFAFDQDNIPGYAEDTLDFSDPNNSQYITLI